MPIPGTLSNNKHLFPLSSHLKAYFPSALATRLQRVGEEAVVVMVLSMRKSCLVYLFSNRLQASKIKRVNPSGDKKRERAALVSNSLFSWSR